MANTHCINGHWQAGSGRAFDSRNPVSGERIWKGDEADADTVAEAVQAARDALGHWKRRSLDERVAIVQAFKTQLETHKEELAFAIGQETGKPLWDARTEVAAMIGKVDLSIDAYHERTGERVTATPGGQRVLRHRPHGVMAVFGPFNFPGHLPNGHIVPALIAGNTVVFKPSEQTPKTAEVTVRLWQQAGIPGGVINLVQGARTTGEALAGHRDVNGILFTGSAATGAAIQKAVLDQPQKILALEMGGNNPLIIGNDLDIRAASWAALQSAFVSAGQRCTCARRMLVPEGAEGDAFLETFVSAASQLVVGHFDQQDPTPYMGSLISPEAGDRLVAVEKKWLAAGGQTLLPMSRVQGHRALLSPGIIDTTGVPTGDEEVFGPLLTVQRYRDFEEALQLANDTRYGLSAGLLGNDKRQYAQFMEEIHAGIVNWNQPITGASSAMPFGGVGLSGNYRPSAWYAADYCAYPVATLEQETLALPDQLPPGMTL
ncbi:MAG: succinylglutamate-semialdehyde dehydrogenase [Pseudohongiellaceae bacterium]